jgi:PAS domain S-box-containing protein
MPGIDGIRTLAALKEIDSDLEVLMITGYATVDSTIAALRHGASDFLLKPIGMSQLGPAIQRALRKRVQSRQPAISPPHNGDSGSDSLSKVQVAQTPAPAGGDENGPKSPEATAQEIAERKRAEKQGRLQTAALESAVNAIAITNRAGSVIWVNPAFTRLTGYSSAEIVGQNPRLLKSGTHDRAFYQELWKTIASGKAWSGEMVNRRKDGSLYNEEMTITPVQDSGGKVTHYIAI